MGWLRIGIYCDYLMALCFFVIFEFSLYVSVMKYALQIQLVRIESRVPEYGWTTQKVFHFLNFLVNAGVWVFPFHVCMVCCVFLVDWHLLCYSMNVACPCFFFFAVRSVIFVFRRNVQRIKPEVAIILLDWLDFLQSGFCFSGFKW